MSRMTSLLPVLALLLCGAVSADQPIEGEPLPADGGAPFLAFLDHIKVIHEGDFDAMRTIVGPAQWQEGIEQAGSEEAAKDEFLAMLPFIQSMTPTRAEFVDGVAGREQARLNARTWGGGLFGGDEDEASMTQVDLIQEEGRWYVTAQASKSE